MALAKFLLETTVSALKYTWMDDQAGPTPPTDLRQEGWPQRLLDPSSGDPPPPAGLLAQLGLSNPILTQATWDRLWISWTIG